MPENAAPGSSAPGNSAPPIANYRWDEIFDVIVVGSGGGALTAGLLAARGGVSTVVVEKSEFIGGTTAVSGGDMWIPSNRFVRDRDSREDAIAYVDRLSDGRAADPSLIGVYVDSAPEAHEYLLETTGYDSEPHLTLNYYYSVIGDRIPGVNRRPELWRVWSRRSSATRSNRAPVTGPPFGAIQQWPGTIGTNGGLRIDKDARVLGHKAPIMDGLYAAGNTAASVMGAVYAGGGSCIGPSVTMGYRAGQHLAGKAARDIGTVAAEQGQA